MKIIALVAAYNEADVIAQVIGDLIAQGVLVYLIDHASSDGTVEAARPFLDRGLLGIERFPEESGFPKESRSVFVWESLLERKQQLAQLLDGDWFLHSDADELRESPFPECTLSQALAGVDQLGYNAVDFAVLNFVPTNDDFRPGADLRAHFAWYEPGQPYDRLQIKCWKKQGSPVDLCSSGGHEARFPGRRVFPIRFLDRHYPVRTQAQGERKVFVERKPRFVDGERQRGWHVQYDRILPGHRFLQSPSELLRFDPTETRRALFEAHRGAEAAEGRARELERILSERVNDLAVRARQVEEQERELDAARRALQDQTAVASELQHKLDGLTEGLRGAEMRIDEIYASRTWRWTAPGRLLWRLVRD